MKASAISAQVEEFLFRRRKAVIGVFAFLTLLWAVFATRTHIDEERHDASTEKQACFRIDRRNRRARSNDTCKRGRTGCNRQQCRPKSWRVLRATDVTFNAIGGGTEEIMKDLASRQMGL